MSQNLTRFDNGIQIKPATGALSNDGELKFDSSVSGFIARQAGATGQLLVSSTTGVATLNQNVAINGNESITGTLGVSGAATINNNLTATGNLGITGTTTIGGALSVSGTAIVNGAATVNNNLTATGNLAVSGSETLNGTLTVNNNATITGTLTIDGAASAGSLASSAEILLKEITTPANPASGFLKLYPKSDNNLYTLNSSGTETALTGGGGGGGGLTPISITSNTALSTGNMYLVAGTSALTLTMPISATLGSQIGIVGASTAGWVLQSASGASAQTVYMGSASVSSASSTVSLASSPSPFDSIILTCTVANNTWVISSSEGGTLGQFQTFAHSYWHLSATGGGEVNSVQSSGLYDLVQVGSVGFTTGHVSPRARGTYSAGNYLKWSAGGSSATIFDTQNFVTMAWFKTSVTGLTQAIITKGQIGSSSGWGLLIDNTNHLYMNYGSGASSFFKASTATVTDNNWHFAVMAKIGTTGTTSLLYLDNVLVGSFASTSMAPSINDLQIGADTGLGSYFGGYLQEVQYWNGVPASQAALETIINAEWNSGNGRPF